MSHLNSDKILEMISGKVIEKCPRCGESMDSRSSLSRRDNKTEICIDCGTEEALIDVKMLESTENEIEFLKIIKGE